MAHWYFTVLSDKQSECVLLNNVIKRRKLEITKYELILRSNWAKLSLNYKIICTYFDSYVDLDETISKFWNKRGKLKLPSMHKNHQLWQSFNCAFANEFQRIHVLLGCSFGTPFRCRLLIDVIDVLRDRLGNRSRLLIHSEHYLKVICNPSIRALVKTSKSRQVDDYYARMGCGK